MRATWMSWNDVHRRGGRLALLGFAAWVATLPLVSATLADETGKPTPADLLPDHVLATLTVRDGAGLVRDLRAAPIFQKYLDSEAYEALQSQPDYLKAQGGLLLFAGTAGTDAWTLAAQSLGRELLLALLPGPTPDKPRLVMVITPDDEAAAQRILDALLGMAGAKVNGEAVKERSRVVDGIIGYGISGEAFVAAFDGQIVFANNADTLADLITARKGRTGKLAEQVDFKQAAAAVPAAAAAWGFINVEQFRKAVGPAWEKKIDNAFGLLLAGGWIEQVRRANSAALWLAFEPKAVTLSGRTFGGGVAPAPLQNFQVAADETRDWSKFDIPGLLSQVELARGWTGIWDDREKMLDAEGLRGLTEFAATMTTLMNQLDFSAELLPELRPTLRLIAARQQWEGKPPTPELPAFAIVLHLKDATKTLKSGQKLVSKLEGAALGALSLINYDAGSKMQPQYDINVDVHSGTKMIIAKYPPNLDPGPAGIRYNFEPSVAVLGDRFVITTSRKMLENIIDAFAKLPAAKKSEEPAADLFVTDMRQLYRVLDANREALVTNRMLEQDIDRERAARDVRMLLDAARILAEFSIVTQPLKDGLALKARLALTE